MTLQTRVVTPILVMALMSPVFAASKKSPKEIAGSPVLWREPADIASRDMIYGPGGAQNQPKPPFQFEKEDTSGSNPKFVITDADGTKWKVKLGEEARPETAAARFLWAAGYFADEDYFLPNLVMRNTPFSLHRGQNQIEPDGLTHNARLKRSRKGEEKLGTWQWRDNPFTGTREFNGLRVMMALINNWDLKDVNNTVYQFAGIQIYAVTDLGASFGTTGRSVTRAESKGNLEAYTESKFITKMTADSVDFGTPSRPALIHALEIPAFKARVEMEWIGKQIPLADARWIGQILSRLSREQIQAAFGASGYSPKEVVGFSAVVEARIAELNKL
jgi:hypothetical protein